MMCNRRQFLRTSTVVGAGLLLPSVARASFMMPSERHLSLYNTHTGETFKRVFWTEGVFIQESLMDINRLLRDHRTNDIIEIDHQLLNLLADITEAVGYNDTVHIISGYRSPQSNQELASKMSGVAKHSLHMEGKAIDIRLPGRNLSNIRKAALSLRSGGVGYYPKSQFVHIDTGRVRSW